MSARGDPLDYQPRQTSNWPTLRTKLVIVAIVLVLLVAFALIFIGTAGWSM
jgi:hypothetical protein